MLSSPKKCRMLRKLYREENHLLEETQRLDRAGVASPTRDHLPQPIEELERDNLLMIADGPNSDRRTRFSIGILTLKGNDKTSHY